MTQVAVVFAGPFFSIQVLWEGLSILDVAQHIQNPCPTRQIFIKFCTQRCTIGMGGPCTPATAVIRLLYSYFYYLVPFSTNNRCYYKYRHCSQYYSLLLRPRNEFSSKMSLKGIVLNSFCTGIPREPDNCELRNIPKLILGSLLPSKI